MNGAVGWYPKSSGGLRSQLETLDAAIARSTPRQRAFAVFYALLALALVSGVAWYLAIRQARHAIAQPVPVVVESPQSKSVIPVPKPRPVATNGGLLRARAKLERLQGDVTYAETFLKKMRRAQAERRISAKPVFAARRKRDAAQRAYRKQLALVQRLEVKSGATASAR
ncbi:MAG: hypothetical protein ACT4TC_07145 [Myxococcaceae bacterium]